MIAAPKEMADIALSDWFKCEKDRRCRQWRTACFSILQWCGLFRLLLS